MPIPETTPNISLCPHCGRDQGEREPHAPYCVLRAQPKWQPGLDGDVLHGAHLRGCRGNEYECVCGYDDAKDSELKQVRDALKVLYEETAGYIRVNNLGAVHHNRSMQMARDALGKYSDICPNCGTDASGPYCDYLECPGMLTAKESAAWPESSEFRYHWMKTARHTKVMAEWLGGHWAINGSPRTLEQLKQAGWEYLTPCTGSGPFEARTASAPDTPILLGTKLTYLATPYTRYPGGHDAAFELACQSAAVFLAAGIPVFSPIAHSHPIAQHMTDEHLFDHDLWVRIDAPMLAACHAMIVVTADGWRESRGVQHEIAMFERDGKSIVYWSPGEAVPMENANAK